MSAGVIGDSPLFVLEYALRVLRVLVLLSLWRMILEGRPSSGGMPLGSVLTYTLISEVFAQQLQLRTTLKDAFWEGTLVIRFLRPMGLVRQLSAEMLGRWAMFAANVLASIAIVLAFEYTWGSLAFWAPRAAEEINSDSWRLLTQLAPFPLDGMAGLALVSLVTADLYEHWLDRSAARTVQTPSRMATGGESA